MARVAFGSRAPLCPRPRLLDMTEPLAPSGDPAGARGPVLLWRIPAYQPAIGMLVLCAAAALNIYAHPSQTVRIVSLAIGLGCGVLAVAGLRMQLLADDDGVAVRQLIGQAWLPWSVLADIEVVPEVRGAATIRFTRVDGSYVDVPPSLLQPAKPTGRARALGQLEHTARRLRERRPASP